MNRTSPFQTCSIQFLRLIEKGGITNMNKTSFGLKMKESQLVHYLEEHTTEEIINEIHERWFPSFHFHQIFLLS